MRYAVTLAKIRAAMPTPKPVEVEKRVPFDFRDFFEKLETEEERVKAMSPAQRIKHHLDHIKRLQEEAAQPAVNRFPYSTVDLSESFHACLVQEVKNDFPMDRYQIRADEIAILQAAGYDCTDIARDHQAMAQLPWQWNYYAKPLSPHAESLIDSKLKSLEVAP